MTEVIADLEILDQKNDQDESCGVRISKEGTDDKARKLYIESYGCQMNFSDSVAKLLVRLEQIDKIKDINEVFWNNTKEQLNEGVSVIEKASKRLSTDIENINAEFYDRLNDTLQNLDNLIQEIINNYRK